MRVKDIDFERHQVVVRRGKGHKDRRTVLPATVKPRLIAHLADVKRQHERDLSDGVGRVVLPAALDRKYPNAGTDWVWQFVFPAGRICRDPRFGPPSRYRLHESVVQRAVTAAVRHAGIPKRASCHTFRHHADNRIMPTTFRCPPNSGGDRAFSHRVISIIRGVRETRAVDPVDDTGLASHQAGWCAPALAL